MIFVLLLAMPQAPVPQPKPYKGITAGSYTGSWYGTRYPITLERDNTYTAKWGTEVYRGTWYYHNHTLHISETRDGVTWFHWSAQDTGHHREKEVFRGWVKYGTSSVDFSMTLQVRVR